jgi:hypothetical protein
MLLQRLNRPISTVWLWVVLTAGAPALLGSALVVSERYGWDRLSSTVTRSARAYYAPLHLLPAASSFLQFGLPSSYLGFGVGAAFYAAVVLLGFGAVAVISRELYTLWRRRAG